MPTIAIVGGGFSGTITAVHLLQRGFGPGSRLVLINRSGAMARGLAYGTQSDHHVLNVPAGRMSAFDDDPDSFVRFVRERGTPVDGGAFVSRHLYGAYLVRLLGTAAARADGVAFERLNAEATRIDVADDDTHAWITTSRGERIRADRVVVAVGNYPPDTPESVSREFFATSRRYIPDPWRPGALAIVDPGATTLLMGTGLTMIDIVLELAALGKTGGSIAVSRRGLLPLPHRAHAHQPTVAELPANLLDGPPTIRAYLQAVRRQVRDAAARHVDWRDVIQSLRPVTPRVWQALPLDERRRFLRHVRPFWEVHRHRVAPLLYESFTRLQQDGFVSLRAARMVSLRDARGGVLVTLCPRGASEPIEVEVGTIINCTGPAGDTRRLRDTLFESLQARGLLTPDVLGLGVETASCGALIGCNGGASSTLYYVGPFLRARDWEATAVPELRRYAERLARHLIDTL